MNLLLSTVHPNGGRADTVNRDFLIMMRPACKTVTRLGLNKFSLALIMVHKGNPNALDAAQTFKAAIQEGQWALR